MLAVAPQGARPRRPARPRAAVADAAAGGDEVRAVRHRGRRRVRTAASTSWASSSCGGSSSSSASPTPSRRTPRRSPPLRAAVRGDVGRDPTVPWTRADDAMLLLGVYKHGLKAYEEVRDDRSELAYSDVPPPGAALCRRSSPSAARPRRPAAARPRRRPRAAAARRGAAAVLPRERSSSARATPGAARRAARRGRRGRGARGARGAVGGRVAREREAPRRLHKFIF